MMLQDAKNNLEEINDMEYCSQCIKKLNRSIAQLESCTEEYLQSDYHAFLSNEKSYLAQRSKLDSDDKENQEILSKIEPFQPEKKDPVEAFISDVIQKIKKHVYKTLLRQSIETEFTSYSTEIDQRNAENKQKYDDHVRSISAEGKRIAEEILKLEAEHPYRCAERAILARTPEFDNIINQIEKYIPQFEKAQPKEHVEKDNVTERDPLFEECARFLVSAGVTASTSSLQRRYSIGYNRAGKIMGQLEAAGIVGPALGSKPRSVLAVSSDLDRIFRHK